MNASHVATVLRRELVVGPRGMMFAMIVLLPILINVVLRLIFGGVFDPEPRLGIVDHGGSAIVQAALLRDDLRITIYDSDAQLRSAVVSNDEDGGLILPAGFDESVAAGAMPELTFFMSGASTGTDQELVAIAVIDFVRRIGGAPAPVNVHSVQVGPGTSVPLVDRLVPLLVLVAVAFAGVFLPAASIVEEKERATINAVLAAPVTGLEFLSGKAAMGALVAFTLGALTLVINAGFTPAALGHMIVIAVASTMCAAIGATLGASVRSMNVMFSVWKSGGIILFAPAILVLFPTVPGWISMLFPTHYFLQPLYATAVEGETIVSQIPLLIVALVISAGLLAALVPVSRKMEASVA